MKEKIEKKRMQLYRLAADKGLKDPAVLLLSKELDVLIQITQEADLSAQQISLRAKN